MTNGIYGKKILDKKIIMKIFVLGPNGMLGRYVSKFLSKSYDVVNVTRNEIDASKVSQESLTAKLFQLGVKKGDVIINCMGTIKPRVDELGDLNSILVNSVFPRILANAADALEVDLIHPTTDCIYSGSEGKYTEADKCDVNDVYGMSKAMGEPPNCTVIRTSIIGEEIGQARSLVEWVKSNANKEVNGFTNHYWNGVTCLQFAKICDEIINNKLFWKGTKHIFSNILNKKELVETISSVYELNITVTPKETLVMVDRTLSTISEEVFGQPTLEQQIIEMRNFYKEL